MEEKMWRKSSLTRSESTALAVFFVAIVLTVILFGAALANETGEPEKTAENAPAAASEEGTESGIDLSSMTDEQIVSLLGQVNAEIVSRNIQKTATLPMGRYIVGQDFPAGRYLFTCIAADKNSYLIEVTEDLGKGDEVFCEYLYGMTGDRPTTVMLTLSEGDLLTSEFAFTLTAGPVITFE